MAKNHTPRRWIPWALTLVGIVMIGFPFAGGFRALQAIGVPIEANLMIVGAVALYLVMGGVLSLIIGLILALKERPAWLIGIGALLLLIGTGPLVLIGLMAKLGLSADPNPNPIGFGMLAAVTFVPALVLLIGGLVSLAKRKPQQS